MSHGGFTGDVPWHNRTVQVVLASTLLAPLGVPLVAPGLPVIRDAFALTDAQASLLVSIYFVIGIVVSPFVGVLADRFGRKRILVPALFVFSLMGLAGYFASNYPTLLALRAIQGTAASALFVTTVTIIGDAFEGVRRSAVLGVNIAALSLGAAAFPILGGALVVYGWNAPFLAYAAGFPVMLFALLALEETRTVSAADGEGEGEREGARGRQSISYLRGALVNITPSMGALLGTAFVTEFLLFGSLVTALPFLMTENFSLAPVFVGLILTVAEVGAVVAATTSGRLARRFSNGEIIALGFTCYGISLGAINFAPTPVLVALAAIVFGAGLGFTMPAVDAGVSERVTQEYRAGLLGLRNSTTFLGRASGPIVFTSLAIWVGYEMLLAAGSVAILAVAAVAFVVIRGSQQRAHDGAGV